MDKMSEELFQKLLKETNESIAKEVKRAQAEAWKDNVFIQSSSQRSEQNKDKKY